MKRSWFRVLALVGALAALSGCTDDARVDATTTSAASGSTTSVLAGPHWVNGSLADLPLPERDGPPRFIGVVVHEFDGVTFLGPRGVVGMIERDIGKFDGPHWVDQDTVTFAGRLDSDVIQVFEASADGTLDVIGPMTEDLPTMVAGDVLMYRRPGKGKDVVGRPGALVPVELAVSFVAPNSDGWFLARRYMRRPMKVLASGQVEPYPLPQGWAVMAAAFGPNDMLAVSLYNGRLVVVSGNVVVEVDRLSAGAKSVGWDQTGTVLVVVTGGEPPTQSRWLKCDLLAGGECTRFTPVEFWHKDAELAPVYWG